MPQKLLLLVRAGTICIYASAVFSSCEGWTPRDRCMAPVPVGPASLLACFAGQAALIFGAFKLNQVEESTLAVLPQPVLPEPEAAPPVAPCAPCDPCSPPRGDCETVGWALPSLGGLVCLVTGFVLRSRLVSTRPTAEPARRLVALKNAHDADPTPHEGPTSPVPLPW